MIPNVPPMIAAATAEGTCPVWLHAPPDGPFLPAVILYMDAPGIRPALHAITAQLAAASYLVALPDLFYRSGPYRLVGRITAELFVASATDDPNIPDAQKARLTAALSDVGVVHRVETRPGRHGWVPRDTPAYNPEQGERHWQVLVPPLDRVPKQRR